MMIDRRLFAHFDWRILGLTLAIAIMGLLNLYSITSNIEQGGTPIYTKQILWLFIGLVIMVFVAFIEYRLYSDFAYIIYTLSILFLIILLAYGMVTSGAQRWFKIGGLSIQPSEFVKITFIITMAKIFQQPPQKGGYSLKDLPLPFFLLALPVVMILKQPDLGTAVILVLVFFSILLFIKIRWSSLLVILLGGTSLIPLLWNFLKDYQKQRSDNILKS